MDNKTTTLVALAVGLFAGLNWPKIRTFLMEQKHKLLAG